MSFRHLVCHDEITRLAREAASAVAFAGRERGYTAAQEIPVYAVPRGGIPAAYAIGQHVKIRLTKSVRLAAVIIDDLVDSGTTINRLLEEFAENEPKPAWTCLIDKRRYAGLIDHPYAGWIVFPWENNPASSLEDNVRRILQFIGENPARGGLLETPARVAKAWDTWAAGYKVDIPSLFKTFTDGAEKASEMVLVKDIPFYSHCEHHMAPFFGSATVGYIPDGKIVGLSKINKLVRAFAQRLQVQERMTTQIADAMNEHLSPKGVGVIVKARHLCMESRGVSQHGHHTVTSALRGVMVDTPVRQEFLNLAQ